jgi:hypothetical protein
MSTSETHTVLGKGEPMRTPMDWLGISGLKAQILAGYFLRSIMPRKPNQRHKSI